MLVEDKYSFCTPPHARNKGKKAKEQREATKELEQSIHMVKAPSVLDKEPSLTLPTKVKISQKQSDMEE
ncbi:hypothetical protein RDI58_025744 [Solanum bulbocastanum]|uniref:Uncharacterized protein n=1 Tax=Solanum bulbocastanum TaxID=147425 RepID=A0AAN8T5M7_SOLBU